MCISFPFYLVPILLKSGPNSQGKDSWDFVITKCKMIHLRLKIGSVSDVQGKCLNCFKPGD